MFPRLRFIALKLRFLALKLRFSALMLRFIALIAVLLVGCTVAHASEALVSFPNATPDSPRRVPGTLYWPHGEGPFPALALFHGCHGVSESTHGWARWLRERGYVALVVDSWAARRLSDGCAATHPDVPSTERFDDAVGALRFLQAQPGVDLARVGAMGWSNGGVFSIAVLNGPSLERAGRRGVALPQPGYQVSVAFYPGGCPSLRQEYVVKPLLVLIGEADDWTLASACREMVENMRSRGAPAEIALYSGAHHYFDVEGQAEAYLPAVGNENHPDGAGATVAFDAAANADAHRRVEQFLARYLGPR